MRMMLTMRTEPASWSRKAPTRLEVARHFGIPARRLRSLTERVTSNPGIGYLAIEDLLDGIQPRPGPGTLLSSSVTELPEGKRAVEVIEAANDLEYGWRGKLGTQFRYRPKLIQDIQVDPYHQGKDRHISQRQPPKY